MISFFCRLAHILRSRKTCHGNCLNCPYYTECRSDLSSNEKGNKRSGRKTVYIS